MVAFDAMLVMIAAAFPFEPQSLVVGGIVALFVLLFALFACNWNSVVIRRVYQVCIVMVCASWMLSLTAYPKKVAFILGKDAFTEISNSNNEVVLDFPVSAGLYDVVGIHWKAGGGVFCRVGDGLWGGIRAVGFAYLPGSMGDEGDSMYSLERVSGDWYWFHSESDVQFRH